MLDAVLEFEAVMLSIEVRVRGIYHPKKKKNPSGGLVRNINTMQVLIELVCNMYVLWRDLTMKSHPYMQYTILLSGFVCVQM